MAELEEEVVFETQTDQVEFKTKTNGDSLHVIGLHLTAEQAASLAWLVNAGISRKLEFEVKLLPEPEPEPEPEP